MKGVFVILDGVADEPSRVLENITPLQAAKTSNLDYLAEKSRIDYCYPLKEGVIPQSSSAVVSLLGQDPNLISRGMLEAKGIGMSIKRGDLALRCNFGTIEDIESREMMDRRAGRTLTTKEAEVLTEEINQKVKLPFDFEFKTTIQHRGVLVFKGGFSDNISNVDPYYGLGTTIANPSKKFSFSKPLDDEDDSRLSADLLNSFVRKSHEILDKHILNRERARKGLFSANFLLCRDAGIETSGFKKLKGKWMGLGYMPLEKGIIKVFKMDMYSFNYPVMKKIDAYDNLYNGLNKAIKNAIKMLKRNWKEYDYFYIHFKETDTPAHDNKPFEKVKMIEILDKKFFSYLKEFMERNGGKLVVTSDHMTSSRLKRHAENPVPVLYYDSKNLRKGEKRFTEEEGLKGRKILGRRLLEKTLFS